ncbi:MAG: DNA gyrase subunit A [Alphaproteobacteria bacterium]
MSDVAAPQPHDIQPVSIEEEMRRSYLDYAMSVIVARALPDVRDGLKPVHRRVLFAMNEEGYTADRPFRKSARVVGDVMGKYHPHGDAAIYDAMVRMAQDFSMRLALIDGQGNFGSMDGDPPAAMRYTEVRLAAAAHTLLEDTDRDTVDFQPNYDASAQEPTVLPAQFPNLLVNGAGGIAVGMATNIPPHNLGEVIDACCAYIENPDIGLEELMELVPGPDFPTGGIIVGVSVIRAAYFTGRGSLIVRGRAHVEEIRRDREAIVITEIPYQVNKARMIERIADLVRERRIEGVADLRDESDREGLRVVVELKREAVADVVLNQLYHYTPLQTTFGVNMLALDGGRPVLMSLKDVIAAFVAFRENVITRRTKFELAKARERAHVLVGLAIAVANLDPVVRLVRDSRDPAAARAGLLARPWPARDVAPLVRLIDEPGREVERGTYRLSEAQARAILDLRLQRLTGLEREKLHEELRSLGDKIAEYLSILRSRKRLLALLKDELVTVRDRFADDRRTALEEGEFEQDIEDLIQREDMVVTVSHGGYIKRVPLSTFRSQRRGGKGRAGMSTREEDFVSRVFVANTHRPVLFFSTAGKVYRLKVYRLPLGTPQARGKALVNLLPLAEGETISTVMPLPDEAAWDDLHLMFATARGTVRRNRLSDFANVPSNGKIAMKLAAGERLIGVRACAQDQDALLATRAGKCVRFPVKDVRIFSGRSSLGVRGVALAEGDEVISMSILDHAEIEVEERDTYLKLAASRRRGEAADDEAAHVPEPAEELAENRVGELAAGEEFILTITASGYGKRTSAYDYRITRRGGKGVENISLTREGDTVVASFPVGHTDQIMLVTDGGQLIRCPVDEIRIMGRRTRGVTLFRIAEDERVVSAARLAEGGVVEGGPEVEEEGGSA